MSNNIIINKGLINIMLDNELELTKSDIMLDIIDQLNKIPIYKDDMLIIGDHAKFIHHLNTFNNDTIKVLIVNDLDILTGGDNDNMNVTLNNIRDTAKKNNVLVILLSHWKSSDDCVAIDSIDTPINTILIYSPDVIVYYNNKVAIDVSYNHIDFRDILKKSEFNLVYYKDIL